MSRFSPTVAPNAGEAFGRALQQSVGAFLQARQQKQSDEAEMLGRGYVPVDASSPIKGPHTPPIVEPQAPAINQGALDTLVQKNTPQDVQAPTQAGQSFGAMLGAQAMPIQVAQSKPQPVGVSPQALSKAAGLDAYSQQPAQPSPVHLLGRDWQMTPQAMASMQASQAMAEASLEDKRAGTAKTRREISKPQLGDPGYAGAMADVAGRSAAAVAPTDVQKAVDISHGTLEDRKALAREQAIVNSTYRQQISPSYTPFQGTDPTTGAPVVRPFNTRTGQFGPVADVSPKVGASAGGIGGGMGSGGIGGLARTSGAITGMGVAHDQMTPYENAIATGAANYDGLDYFKGLYAKMYGAEGVVDKAAHSAAFAQLDKNNPQLANYLRAAETWALEDSQLSGKASDFRTKMDNFVSEIGPNFSPDLIANTQRFRTTRLDELRKFQPAMQAMADRMIGGRGGQRGGPSAPQGAAPANVPHPANRNDTPGNIDLSAHVPTIDEMIKAGKSDAEIRAAIAGRKP